MKEIEKYKIIKKLVENNGNKKNAALKLDCSIRTVYRLIEGYRQSGKTFFVHKNRGRKSRHAIDEETAARIVHLYKTRYEGANFTHFKELLCEHENIFVSTPYISSLLRKHYIISPKAHRSTKKALTKELLAVKNPKRAVASKPTVSCLLPAESAHPRHPRATYLGELIQMDASSFYWFGSEKTHLHIAVDDASGSLVGAWFDYEETLNGYYHVLYQILTNYGIPYQFLTDKRTVFTYVKRASNNVEKDTFTQFAYACKQLGIAIKTTSVPQAKGRVERMNNTLQSRLSTELKSNGITNICAANEFLAHYVKKFNAKFALAIDHNKSAFEAQPSKAEINRILAVVSQRKFDAGCCISYQKQYYTPVDGNNKPVHFRKGTTATVIKAFNNALYACVQEKVYALNVVESHYSHSRELEPAVNETKPKKRYIPPMYHPWKKASFDAFLAKQAHLKQMSNLNEFGAND